jgi:hypothetical protein
VILNDFREKIERNNSELVELLMLKDELTNEQESMLIGKDKQTIISRADHAFLLKLVHCIHIYSVLGGVGYGVLGLRQINTCHAKFLYRDGIFKLLRRPGTDPKESIPRNRYRPPV